MLMQSGIMLYVLYVTINTIILSVIMLNANMLNVVVPCKD